VDAGLKVARSSYIAGFGGTSNVQAGRVYDIPISGTMAHSYITAFDEEIDAFRAFARAHPDNTILLVDTYDTLSGARKACEVGREMKQRGETLRGVRLDSGDMAELSKQVRKMLDDADLQDVQVVASSGFDEYKIAKVLAQGAQLDGFGVGTNMGVSKDAPTTDMAYKMVAYDGRPVLKLSTDKVTLPGEKQLLRIYDGTGNFKEDIIALREESIPSVATCLLTPVMERGKRLGNETLEDARARCADARRRLPEHVARIRGPGEYPVRLSDRLEEQMNAVKKQAKQQIENH
jgi:nicotinate phosphoribosyltransferase